MHNFKSYGFRGAFCLAILGLQHFDLPLADNFEAKAGTLIGVQVATAVSGYTGSAGQYSLSIRYRASYGEKKTSIVNGTVTGEIPLPSCTGFRTVSARTITLGTGSIGVGVKSDWGYYDIGSFTITYSGSSSGGGGGTGSVTSSPIDRSATSGARALLRYIQKQYGTNYLSGQQDAASLLWVTQNIGKTPAIQGNDFIDYSPSRVANSATSAAVEDAISLDSRGGINAFVWHWNAPTGLINTSGKEWWHGFYTDSTTFDVAAALNEGSSRTNYILFLRDAAIA